MTTCAFKNPQRYPPMSAPPTAADKGEVFVFQKITSVWLTGNRRPPTAAGKGVTWK